MRYQPESLLDRLVGGCVAVLAAAIALYLAVRLIEAIWVVLVLILLSVMAVVGVVAVVRWHSQRW